MKYSNWIGVLLIVLLYAACNMVWITVPDHQIEVGGMFNKNYGDFGRPGLMQVLLSIPMILMFIIPRLWAKRTNFFLTGINMAWGLRNFYLIGVICKAGECPERQLGIYLMLAASILIFVMALLPKMDVEDSKN